MNEKRFYFWLLLAGDLITFIVWDVPDVRVQWLAQIPYIVFAIYIVYRLVRERSSKNIIP